MTLNDEAQEYSWIDLSRIEDYDLEEFTRSLPTKKSARTGKRRRTRWRSSTITEVEGSAARDTSATGLKETTAVLRFQASERFRW